MGSTDWSAISCGQQPAADVEMHIRSETVAVHSRQYSSRSVAFAECKK